MAGETDRIHTARPDSASEQRESHGPVGRTAQALEMQYPVLPLQIHSEVNLDMAFSLSKGGGLAWGGRLWGAYAAPQFPSELSLLGSCFRVSGFSL